LHEDLFTYLIRYLNIHKTRNVSDRSCRENQNTHSMCNNIFFFFENRAVYEIMWKKYGTARQVADDNIKRRKSFVCWKTKVVDIDRNVQYLGLLLFNGNNIYQRHPSVTLYVHYLSC
jgi:hypothetical protein